MNWSYGELMETPEEVVEVIVEQMVEKFRGRG